MKRKRKPDLLAVLAVVVGLGVLASSLAQGMLTSSESRSAQFATQNVQQAAFQNQQIRSDRNL